MSCDSRLRFERRRVRRGIVVQAWVSIPRPAGTARTRSSASAAITFIWPAAAVHWREIAGISAEKPARFWSSPPCTSVSGHQLKSEMTDTLEKRLIEALRSVEAHGDVAPVHVHDPMTMLLRENAIQAHLMRWDDARSRYVLTGTGRRRMSAGSRAPGTVVSFRKRAVVNGGTLQRKPTNANARE